MHDSARNFGNHSAVYPNIEYVDRPAPGRGTASQGRSTWHLNATVAMSILCLAITFASCTGASAVTAPDEDSVASVEVVSQSFLVPLGGSLTVSAKVKDNNGRVRDDVRVTWSTSDQTVATVSESGTVTGKSRGRVTISASKGKKSGKVDLEVQTAGYLPAFPGAEGWGAGALNSCRSRPVEVIRVTNTGSDGPGSLAQAVRDVRSDRFTFIIFETGGHIRTPPSEGIRLNSSCVYIAGQTAPGDGVVIQGQKTALWFRGAGDNISDVVLRYLRFRGKSGETNNNIIIAKGKRIVLDHMSFSWTDNYVFAILKYGSSINWSAPIADISVQKSIVSEAFAIQPTGMVINTNGELKESPFIDMTNISVHANLLAHNNHRNPMTAADNTLVANNVIYNWTIGAGMMNRRGIADWVNNYAKAGPMTRAADSYVVNPYCDELGGDFSVYVAGNIGPMSDNAAGDNWSDNTRQIACYRDTGGEKGAEVPAQWQRDTEQSWRALPTPVGVVSAQEAYQSVLAGLGADERLTCDGRWTAAMDRVDQRVLAEVRSGSGVSQPPENEDAVGGYPTYAAGTACADSDRDGLPDAWEDRFFDCETCAEPGAIRRDGYLAIEHYLNGTTP